MPMTDVPETGTKTGFWYVCHAIWDTIFVCGVRDFSHTVTSDCSLRVTVKTGDGDVIEADA